MGEKTNENQEGDSMKHLHLTAAALALVAGPALAQQDTISIGMVLEPPNLDPTGGAAAAIDGGVYAKVFEGLTRFGPDGSVQPATAGGPPLIGPLLPAPGPGPSRCRPGPPGRPTA